MSGVLLKATALSVGTRGADGAVRPIVTGVDLSLAAGETLGIVGESGSGKSTLALALTGYLRPGLERLGGEVRLGGADMFGAGDTVARLRGRRIAVVPQNAAAALTPTMTIAGQFDEALRLHTAATARARRDAMLAALDDLHLPDPRAIGARYPHELSGGQQQRCVLGLAIAGDPELLILDEPTTALDAATQAGVLDLLRRLGERRRMAMIYVSHSLGVVAGNCDRLAVMYAGEIVEQDATRRLLAAPRHPYTSGLLASLPSVRRPGIPPAMGGAPPAQGQSADGCRFAARCPARRPACSVHPQLSPSSGGGMVRCLFPGSAPPPPQPKPRRDAEAAGTLLDVDALRFAYRRHGMFGRLAGRAPAPATLDGVSFALRAGRTLGVIGESGSGKSTLLRVLLGLHAPQGGHARMGDADLGVPLARRPLALKREIQIVFQNPVGMLNPRRIVADTLEDPLRLYFPSMDGTARLRAVTGLLDRVRLGASYLGRYPEQLSGGEKQRVAIALALAARPKLILCDEVTSALDVSVQAAVLGVLDEIQREEGVAYIFVSHDLAIVRAIADEVIVLDRGRVCEAGPADRVFGAPSHPYTAMLLAHTFDPASLPPRDIPPQPLHQEACA